MGILFRPDEMLADISRFDAERAAERGVALAFCDLDNTLTRWNDPSVPATARAFAARLRARGVDLCIVSNNGEDRVRPFARALDADYIARAKKPLPFALLKMMRRRALRGDQCVLLGDQLLTDVSAGNLAGIHTVLVRPIDRSREFAGTKINRSIEGFLFRLMGLRWEDAP